MGINGIDLPLLVYVAAPWVDRDQARDAARKIEAAGHVITREWWEFEAGDTDHDELSRLAEEDVIGVQRADVLIVLNTSKSEGKAVETGLAISDEIPIVLVGKPSNIFHHMDSFIKIVSSVEDAIEYLKR